MINIYSLNSVSVHDSEVCVGFVNPDHSAFLVFLVPIPELNRTINDFLRHCGSRRGQFYLRGIAFDVYTTSVLELKSKFDILTK